MLEERDTFETEEILNIVENSYIIHCTLYNYTDLVTDLIHHVLQGKLSPLGKLLT